MKGRESPKQQQQGGRGRGSFGRGGKGPDQIYCTLYSTHAHAYESYHNFDFNIKIYFFIFVLTFVKAKIKRYDVPFNPFTYSRANERISIGHAVWKKDVGRNNRTYSYKITF